jgi:hypothetical protein
MHGCTCENGLRGFHNPQAPFACATPGPTSPLRCFVTPDRLYLWAMPCGGWVPTSSVRNFRSHRSCLPLLTGAFGGCRLPQNVLTPFSFGEHWLAHQRRWSESRGLPRKRKPCAVPALTGLHDSTKAGSWQLPWMTWHPSGYRSGLGTGRREVRIGCLRRCFVFLVTPLLHKCGRCRCRLPRSVRA